MNELEIVLGGSAGLIVVLIIIAYWRKRKEERQKKIDAAVERIRLANQPGYRPPGSSSMRTTVKDGVITYRKDRSQKKDKSGR
jgi:FtsZ-interacting cell division protein ZipA